jgi:hypothetical protein
VDAEVLLDELSGEQITLSINLECLERARRARPTDPCAAAALPAIGARIEDLGRVRDALAQVLRQSTADRSIRRAFLPDAPLAEYVRGVYAWAHAVVRALDQLILGLGAGRAHWSRYRARVAEARIFHFSELSCAVDDDLTSLALECGDRLAVRRLRAAFAALLAQARLLELLLDDGLG